MGLPSSLDAICKVYPLLIPEIIQMGEHEYNKYVGLLLLDEVEISNIIKEKAKTDMPPEDIDVLTYLIMSAESNNTFLLELQTAFSTFIKEEVLVLPKINSIVVGNPQERRLINSINFKDF